MSAEPDGLAATARRQRDASDPRVSAWVSANAGSGKTTVLARRVVALLLAGSPPSRLLCLTFTKAAAANMANRVFRTLSAWTLADEETLRTAVADLTGEPPDAEALLRARRLFAEAIETPGGLKIQTIHAFCERLLQQFPLEADLAGQFEILDDHQVATLTAAARDQVVIAAAEAPGSALGRAMAKVVDIGGDTGFLGAIDDVVAARDQILAAIREDRLDGDAIRVVLGIDPSAPPVTEADWCASPDFPETLIRQMIGLCRAAGGTKINELADRLEAVLARPAPTDARETWLACFFTTAGTPRAFSTFGYKPLRTAIADLEDRFERECARLLDLQEREAAARAAEASLALMTIAEAVIGRYEAAKRSRGALDFGDLIRRAVALLSRNDAALWVQYKLDQGIDHILVDEAQDTSPLQWTIVAQLAEEFFAGESARPRNRTIFAVGDEKQSIFSFQGARPRTFAMSRDLFAGRAKGVGLAFRSVGLNQSFRSTPDVLRAVDLTFAGPEMREGVAGPDGWQDHTAVRHRHPGHVEIWDIVERRQDPEPEDWTAPVDTRRSPALELAARIADEIARLTAPGFLLPGTGKRVRPRDVLILVRKRGAFVDAMNRVLKERGIPVAGADRLRLTEHVAVEDLMALGRVMLLPEDDLSLAAVLKGPLFGWDDDRLYGIAANRSGRQTLASALSAAADGDAAAREAAERLARWRGRADYAPPFEFFAEILSTDGGRRRFVERLGPEAEDVIDEFLARALAFEEVGVPSLAGFLAMLESAAPEIKREMDEARDEVRVMTVHGAKGLEAPVVFMVETGSKPVTNAHDAAIVPLPVPGLPEAAPVPVWNAGKAYRCRAIQAALDAARAEKEQEYRRLLYVAMTRAADRLIVTAFQDVEKFAADCWYNRIRNALEPQAVRDATGPFGRLVFQDGERPAVAPERDAAARAEAAGPLPGWLTAPVAVEAAAKTLRPSAALREAALAGIAAKDGLPDYPAVNAFEAALEPESDELLRGKVVHKLLEVLPDVAPPDRRRAALDYAARRLGGERAEAVAAEVLRVIDDPAFAAAFAQGSRAEVAIVGRLVGADGTRYDVSGQIDRLAVTEGAVLIVDYKTNRRPPAPGEAPPPDYVSQMAVYRRLLGDLYPGRAIRCAILWTARPALVPIADFLIDEALAALALT
jgi:ATP-dependent helicase/nuclease subunit A